MPPGRCPGPCSPPVTPALDVWTLAPPLPHLLWEGWFPHQLLPFNPAPTVLPPRVPGRLTRPSQQHGPGPTQGFLRQRLRLTWWGSLTLTCPRALKCGFPGLGAEGRNRPCPRHPCRFRPQGKPADPGVVEPADPADPGCVVRPVPRPRARASLQTRSVTSVLISSTHVSRVLSTDGRRAGCRVGGEGIYEKLPRRSLR